MILNYLFILGFGSPILSHASMDRWLSQLCVLVLYVAVGNVIPLDGALEQFISKLLFSSPKFIITIEGGSYICAVMNVVAFVSPLLDFFNSYNKLVYVVTFYFL